MCVALQIFKKSHYQALSDNNRILTRLLEPLRGNIKDLNGKNIALNENVYRCVLAYDAEYDNSVDLIKVGKILKLSEEEIIEIKKEISKKYFKNDD